MATRESDLVSVVIPCYNQAHFLGDAIDSVLEQTYQRFEILVVDDGSTDNTAEVAARYPGVRCIRQENQGLSAARNTGLRESLGEYLVFLDSDDRLRPHALQTGLKHLAGHPECAFVAGHCRYIAADGTLLPTPSIPIVERDHYLTLLRTQYIWMPAMVIFRHAIFDEVGDFNTALRASEDYDLYLRIARDHPIHCHTEVVAEYRRHGESMSQKYPLMLKNTAAVLRAQQHRARGNKQYEQACKIGIRRWRAHWGDAMVNQLRSDVRRREWRPVMKTLLAVLRYYPGGFVTHACRKLYCVIFRVKSDYASS